MADQSLHMPRRIGILGSPTDPVGQLLQDQPHRHADLFFPLSDPADAKGDLDEIVVLSQSVALAHLPALIASNIPCIIILRRRTNTEQHREWAALLQLLAQSLALHKVDRLTFLALTDAAAEEIRHVLDLPLQIMPPLCAVPESGATIAVDRTKDEVTFFLQTPDGEREARRAEISAFNWVRLRRRAVLRASDQNDLDMQDMAAIANGLRVPSHMTSGSAPLKMLAVVPNGVGLGHITRMMALAKALQSQGKAEVTFWCFSRAAEILQAAGFPIILRQTAMHLQAHPPDWRAVETQEFALAIQTLKPDVISYDGAMIDPFVFNAMRMPGCGRAAFLWVRRGMLRPDSDPLFMENEQFCDLILEPGDLAVEMDKGPTQTRQAEKRGFSQKYVTAPVSLATTLTPYSRRDAKNRMKLGWGKHCLISLGGAFGDWDALEAMLHNQARRFGVKLIWAQSPLAAPPTSTNTMIRRLFPLSRYLPGIDGVVTATGYNSFHELMLTYDKPVLFAPTNHVRMDDQVARASYAAHKGWASVVNAEMPDDMEARIASFMQQVKEGVRFPDRPKTVLDQAAFANRLSQVASPYQNLTHSEAAE